VPECITDVWFWCKKCKIFLGRGHSPLPRPVPQWGGDTPSPRLTPLGTFSASILTPPILKFCLRYWSGEYWLCSGEGKRKVAFSTQHMRAYIHRTLYYPGNLFVTWQVQRGINDHWSATCVPVQDELSQRTMSSSATCGTSGCLERNPTSTC